MSRPLDFFKTLPQCLGALHRSPSILYEYPHFKTHLNALLPIGREDEVLKNLGGQLLDRDLKAAKVILELMNHKCLQFKNDLLRREAYLYDRQVFPPWVPTHDWNTPHPLLYEGFYLQWYAGRITNVYPKELTLRVRKVDHVTSKTSFGTLTLNTESWYNYNAKDIEPQEGMYLEAVKLYTKEWQIKTYLRNLTPDVQVS